MLNLHQTPRSWPFQLKPIKYWSVTSCTSQAVAASQLLPFVSTNIFQQTAITINSRPLNRKYWREGLLIPLSHLFTLLILLFYCQVICYTAEKSIVTLELACCTGIYIVTIWFLFQHLWLFLSLFYTFLIFWWKGEIQLSQKLDCTLYFIAFLLFFHSEPHAQAI